MKPSYTAHFNILHVILTQQTVFFLEVGGAVGGAVGGLEYLKRCLQALPTSPYRPPFFVAFPLLVRIFRSSALIKSLVQAGSLINLRHLQFAALSIKLKYPKSLTTFCVYHNQFSRCISYSNLNSQRVFFTLRQTLA